MDYPCRERKIKRMQQLRARLADRPETIYGFMIAAQQKYWEGMELAIAGRRGAAIYLMGYAAEMFLKVAAFRFDGASIIDKIAPRLAPARIWMKNRHPDISPEYYHSLLFWMEYLRAKRSAEQCPLEEAFDKELIRRVRRLYHIWWWGMRYRPDQARVMEMEYVFRDITWLSENYSSLWS